MKLREYNAWGDGVCLRCLRCGSRKSVRGGSFFERSNYTLGNKIYQDAVGNYFIRCRVKVENYMLDHPIQFEHSRVYEADEIYVKRILVMPPDYRTFRQLHKLENVRTESDDQACSPRPFLYSG